MNQNEASEPSGCLPSPGWLLAPALVRADRQRRSRSRPYSETCDDDLGCSNHLLPGPLRAAHRQYGWFGCLPFTPRLPSNRQHSPEASGATAPRAPIVLHQPCFSRSFIAPSRTPAGKIHCGLNKMHSIEGSSPLESGGLYARAEHHARDPRAEPFAAGLRS